MQNETPTRDESLSLIASELGQIRVLLETMLAPPQEPSPSQEPTCSHPEEARISFGMTNGQEDWQCGICQFRPPL